MSAAASSPYAPANRRSKEPLKRYSWVPTTATAYADSIEPICAQRSSDSSQDNPAMKPARKASPTPVGSRLAVSWAIGTSIGS